MNIRNYAPSDYGQLKTLYLDSSFYGGQFDEARDSEERLRKIGHDSILVAEDNGMIFGTVSLIDDGRVAWLFRFAVKDNDLKVARALKEKAIEVLKSRGHTQVLVYSPIDNKQLDRRYLDLGFNKGGDYTAYWQEV
ncbi:MAG: GNAT family N-acetyltransferase [Candidatus Microsaccharimonas sp.]